MPDTPLESDAIFDELHQVTSLNKGKIDGHG